jgi:hypothetical protein
VGCNQQRFLPWAVARQRLDATLDGMLGGKSEDVERGEGRGGLGGCRLKVGEALARTGPLLSSLDSMRLSPSRSLSLSLSPLYYRKILSLLSQLKCLSPIVLFISSPCSCQILSPIAAAFGRRPGRNDLHAVKRAKVRHGSVSVETSTKPREFHGCPEVPLPRDLDHPMAVQDMI